MYRVRLLDDGRPSWEHMPADYVPGPGEVMMADAPTPETLAAAFPTYPVTAFAEAKAEAAAIVSAAAERARLRFVSPGSGKAMAYQEKAKEADDFLADPAPTQLKYPLIFAEVGLTAPTPAEVAAVIRQRRDAFKQVEARISRAETAAKLSLAAAKDAAEVAAILADLTWPAP